MPKINKMVKSDNFVYASGKRKASSARVRLYKGKGEDLVNDKPISDYFPGAICKLIWSQPFKITETLDKYYMSARVVGGGKASQLEAVTHGIAKALAGVEEKKFRLILKKAGLLTRDSRIRERRMVGTGGKARRKKQSPKR